MSKAKQKIETESVRKIGFKKTLSIIKRAYSEVLEQIIKYKVLSLFLFLLVFVFTYLNGISANSEFITEGFNAQDIVYNNDPMTIISNLMSPLYYVFVFFWVFTYFSVRFDYKNKKLSYFSFINPRFYFYIISFSMIIFTFSWLMFAFFYNNYDVFTYSNLFNPDISIVSLFLNEMSELNNIGIALMSSLFFLILYTFLITIYLFFIFFYNGYCMRRGLTNSFMLSVRFLLKNKIFSNFFIIFMCLNMVLIYFINRNLDTIFIFVINSFFVLVMVNAISLLMKNTVRMIKY